MSEQIRSIEYESPPITPTLFFVCGMSAVGKTMLAEHAIDLFRECGIYAIRPVGYTTRDRRDEEVAGVDYNFVSIEDYLADYAHQIQENPEEWDVDKIGDHFYFNRMSDTIPTANCPVSVLPVSLELCNDMVEKYKTKYPSLNIRVIAILLDKSNVKEWEARMAVIRPCRDISRELLLNDTFSPPSYTVSKTITPTWKIETDKVQFISTLLSSLELQP